MKIIFVFLFFRLTALVSQLTIEGRPAFLQAMEEADRRIEPESFKQMKCPIESSSFVSKCKSDSKAEEKARQEDLKAERKALKRELRKGRSTLRRMAEESNYYSKDPSEIVRNKAQLEKMLETLKLEE